MKNDGFATINPNIRDQLRSESTKCRSNDRSHALTPNLIAAAKSLKANDKIVIRRADKSAEYVIMNKTDYFNKLNQLISDTSKFKHITRSPILQLKRDLNALIKTVNAQIGHHVFEEIVSDYSEGYIYGNPKTHKHDIPLRPIISQVLTPTYKTAKHLDRIIKPYIPSRYSIKSRDEFVDILRTAVPSADCHPMSLDAESLFTNVPVQETVDIIMNNVYHHPFLKPPSIPQGILREMLLICTTKVPFRHINTKLFLQSDGISMGSPLGPTFAEFYMSEVEKRVVGIANIPVYVRYVDDIFVYCSKDDLMSLKSMLEDHSVLKFTCEFSVNDKLPFLDVLVHKTNQGFSTSVFHKPTDKGICLNAMSECPQRYKVAVLTSFLKRAYLVSSDWNAFHSELHRIKQTLVNNGYSNSFVDNHVSRFVAKIDLHHDVQQPISTTKKVYYKNNMSKNYLQDEHAVKKIIRDNVKVNKAADKLQVIVYYQNVKTSNLVISNNLTRKALRPVARCNVVYEFNCPMNECFHSPNGQRYIGHTTCALSRRLTMHLQGGSIQDHFIQKHERKITRQEIVENTSIRYIENDVHRLKTLECILIYFDKPRLNEQLTGSHRMLSLFG